jgi:asparagine synthase (glutamine-hydrolysing)
MRGELQPLVSELLSKDSLSRIGFFNQEYVNQLVRDHMDGTQDNRKQLWTLMVFVMWWNWWMGENEL